MIAHIEGKVRMRGDKFLIINANGVSYHIFTGHQVIKKARNGENFSLWTHLYVRENAMELFGFLEYAELEFFKMLIQISGIGPKSALGVLAVAPLDTLKKAISSGETSYLTKVSGIGRKSAEKIILELQDKLGALGDAGAQSFRDEQDVLQALQSLGYSLHEAREALRRVPMEIEGAGARIKEALKMLGK